MIIVNFEIAINQTYIFTVKTVQDGVVDSENATCKG